MNATRHCHCGLDPQSPEMKSRLVLRRLRVKPAMTMLCAFLLLISCQGKQAVSSVSTDGQDSLYYAQNFTIESYPGYEVISIRNPWKEGDILQTYVLVPENLTLPDSLPEGTLLRTPLTHTVTFSSVVCGMMDELGVTGRLVGVGDATYILTPSIQAGLADGSIQDVGQEMQPNVEKLILLEPQLIMTTPINESAVGALRATPLHAPTIPCLDYLENHPLGQAEWIRLFGRLFGEKELADSLFFATVEAYESLRQSVSEVKNRPTVFTEKKYGDFWYVPGGKSYTTHLLQDAGADYIWKDNSSTGNISLSFETVLDKAEKADFWLIKYYQLPVTSYQLPVTGYRLSDDDAMLTYRQLVGEDPKYALFDAFKNHNIYACNTAQSTYYQEVILHPDRLLQDLIKVFHPELLPDYELKFYLKCF
ncbi:MAG: ABC transporter substrate-binding protein [Candidatus Symbiothrix sp.]|jgi:iron complex transport system substrate-binding protein|nr:ABC transporter substrate-binding protein [Candidatus Symbiothrix sp.]